MLLFACVIMCVFLMGSVCVIVCVCYNVCVLMGSVCYCLRVL